MTLETNPSTQSDFSINKRKLILLSLKACGVLTSGDTPESDIYNDCSDILNMMLKSMRTEGLQLWLRKPATLFLESGVNKYILGSSGSHATYSYVRTTVKTTAIATATTIDVTATTDMVAGYYIGFILDDGTSYWTTISTVVDGDTITIPAAGLPSQATAGNYVYCYASKIDKPNRIFASTIKTFDGIEREVFTISQSDYNRLSSKSQTGSIVNIAYIPQKTNGHLYVWPVASTLTDTFEFISERQIIDMDSDTDLIDCPQEWYEAIYYGLSYRLASHFNINSSNIVKRLELNAATSLANASAYDVENTSVFFYPTNRR